MKVRYLLFYSLFLLCYSCKENQEDTIPSAPQAFECSIERPSDKESRTIGIDLLNVTETNSFNDNINFAKELGIEFIALHMNWSAIEPSPGNFTDPSDAIRLLGEVAQNNDMKFSLTIRPIDLTGKTVPGDLENIRFNDPMMTTRFNVLLDYVFTLVSPNTLLNLQIGNEIDGYNTSDEHPDFWSDYGAFLFNAKTHIHSLYPTLKVGYTATLDGLIKNPTIFTALNNAVDILGVTYYPLKSNFDVEDPDIVMQDLNDLVSIYSATPIYLQEVGYQSSATNNSSEVKQAAFFCHFFKAWDQHKDQIHSANLVRMNDLSSLSAIESAGPYGISNDEFIEYLRTLGIRSFQGNGQNKEAFEVIKENLEARGW